MGLGGGGIYLAGSVIAGGSVVQALRGKHYRRGLRCILLMREVLIHIRIGRIRRQNDFSETDIENINVLFFYKAYRHVL